MKHVRIIVELRNEYGKIIDTFMVQDEGISTNQLAMNLRKIVIAGMTRTDKRAHHPKAKVRR